jgi:hypothetical protein
MQNRTPAAISLARGRFASLTWINKTKFRLRIDCSVCAPPTVDGRGELVTGCRATQSDTTETFALRQRPSSISPYRRAADHQVREVACIGIGVPTPVPLRETTQAEFSNIRGLETSAQVRDCNMLNWTSCYRKTWFHLHNGVKQRLAAEADRAVVNGPSNYCIMCTCGAQAILSDHQPMKSPCGLPRFTISRQYA